MDHNVCYISDPQLFEECSKIPNIAKRVRPDKKYYVNRFNYY